MKRATIFLTGGLAASLLAGCAAKASPQRAPIAIGIEAAATAAPQPVYVGAGSVAAAHTYHLAFDVPGRIAAVSVDVGDRVRAGETLAQLESSDYLAEAQAAAAQAMAARAQALRADNGARPQERAAARQSVEAARSELDRAQAAADLAHANLARYEALWSDGAISQQQHDAARAADRDAQDRVASARAALAQTESAATIVLEGARVEDRQAARASADAAQANADLSVVTLAKTRLAAPVDAYVQTRSIEPGDEASVGAVAFVLISLVAPEVRINVPERFLASLHRGMRAHVSSGDATYVGVITRIEPAADPETRTAEVRVKVPGLVTWPGVVVSVSLGEQRHLTDASIPLSAVITDADGRTSVLVYRPLRASVAAQSIRVAAIAGDRALVEGLAPGVPVVTAGQHQALPGDAVRLVPANERTP